MRIKAFPKIAGIQADHGAAGRGLKESAPVNGPTFNADVKMI
jgi:hypothetical protein